MSFTSISDSAMSANCLSISICFAVLRPSTLFQARLLRMHVFGRVCVCVCTICAYIWSYCRHHGSPGLVAAALNELQPELPSCHLRGKLFAFVYV